jgi:hypothetical protein
MGAARAGPEDPMPPVLEPAVRAFLEQESVGTVVTLRGDGRARQTLVYYVLAGDRILISTEAQRGKARDVQRTS